MVQTNFEEMQKLGEKLQNLVEEARPLLKDLKTAIKQWSDIEKHITHALHLTMEKAEEAAGTYKLCKELDRVIAAKLHNTLENAKMVDEELRRLNELHLLIQKDIKADLNEIPKFTGGRIEIS